MPGRRNLTPLIRFLQYVQTGSVEHCWEWQGSLRSTGYGQCAFKGRNARKAHRVAYELFYGIDPSSNCVLHKCDNRKCVNLDHLFLGTKKDNTQDMLKKGRHRPQSFKGEQHPAAKLSEAQVLAIRADPEPPHKVAHKYGIARSYVGQIKRRDCWKHI